MGLREQSHFGERRFFMRYDADRIIEDADPLEVVSALGMDSQKRGKNVFIRCPGHLSRMGHIDEHMSNAWLTRNGYYCSSCGKAVSVIEMVMEVKGCSYWEALAFVADLNGGRELYVDKSSVSKYDYSHSGTKQMVPQKKVMPLKREMQEMIGLLGATSFEKCFCPIFVYPNEPEETAKKHGRMNADGSIDYEWLVLDRTKRMSLVMLYEEDYEAYLWLIKEKCGERLEIIKDILSEVGESKEEVWINISYVLRKMQKQINAEKKECEEELDRIKENANQQKAVC